MAIKSLGYVGVESSKLEDWEGFATRLLGMQKVDAAAKVRAFRMDDRQQRLVVTGAENDGLGFLGWEAESKADLEELAARLDNAGVAVSKGTRALADERRVADLIAFRDPGGHRVEVFHGQEISPDPFKPGRPISGFKTGPLGMGHVVMNVATVDDLLPFYRDLLGFRITDYGLSPYPLYFLHINGRHHSFAMVGSGKRSFHHFMVEMQSFDDVGQGYDLAQLEEGRIAYTLGRHTNDHMTSFYAHSPSDFFVEYGWGAQVIDPGTWQPFETFDGPSLWGHERLHLPEEQRVRMRNMRLDAAARGVRVPDPNCAWLASVVGQE
ncbi:VOC family protein [Bradyrhizobium japonicum]|uniref:VOC family protein n=1 Tax=Bradyrhizobium TaxID=374 RepID=UPI001BA864C4|nr:VOC family protein [Bradyrhizobium japonicum]MBR0803433.1 VOC family protein [Bradyrhizobium japonicum]UQD76161.1 VOC family protein [Bradyrhizobium japonicum]